MAKRLRALLTRIQTMRTSTMVAIGIIVGLVLIFYLKETEYNRRVALREKRAEESIMLTDDELHEATGNIEHKKVVIQESAVSIRDTKDGDLQSVTEETTSTTAYTNSTTTMDITDAENNMEDILKRKIKIENKPDDNISNTEGIGDENNATMHDEVTMSNDVLSANDRNEVNDSADSAEAAETTPDKVSENNVKELDVAEEGNHDVQTVNDGKVDIVAKETPVSEMKQNQNKLPLTDINQPPKIKMELNPSLNQYLNQRINAAPVANVETKQEVDNGYKAQPEKNENVPQAKEQIQSLVRKYSATLNETELPRQQDSYMQRLRDKLVQTGRFDLMSNEKCKKRLPKSIIIGVMKAGTEAFSTFLGLHPQVAMQFGYTAMAFFNGPQFKNGYDWYRERMMCSTADQVTMEKSPQYFSSPLAPKRIHDMDPNMKIIMLVRNPIARAVSHFLQQNSAHPERLKARSFEECVYDNKTNKVIGNSPYVQQSTYSAILKRWLEYFPYKQVLVIDGDTFKKNPTRSLSKTESFLGIDHSISKDRLYLNKEKGFYCLKINSTLPEDLEMSCLGSEKGRTHPSIEPLVENALKKYFQPFNEEFMAMTRMNMNW